MCTSGRTTSSRTYLSLEQSFCNGANTLTETAEVAVRAVAAATGRVRSVRQNPASLVTWASAATTTRAAEAAFTV